MSDPRTSRKLEVAIKAAVLNHLKDKGKISQSSTIISELMLNKFARRVDLAIISEQRAYAFEIKSEGDNLSRLDGQIREYLNYFDRVTIVTVEKHTEKILAMVPTNVAVWEIEGSEIIVKQRGHLLPIVSLDKIIRLLKMNELFRLLNSLSLSKDSFAEKDIEKALLAASGSKKAIRNYCLQCIKKRYKYTAQRFWDNISAREISPHDIALLSRSRDQRVRIAAKKSDKGQFWSMLEAKIDRYSVSIETAFVDNPNRH